jgi:peptidyl-prolyl cis-trans isomerase B (cyclophilin B)
MKTDFRKFGLIIGVQIFFVLLLVLAVFVFGKETVKVKNPIATIETNMGIIKMELYPNEAPKTVANFVGLAKNGYYNNAIYHRVIPGFIIQGGDPEGKTDQGKSIFGGEFEDEIDLNSQLYKTGYVKGIVAMANHGANTNSTQFFMALDDINPVEKQINKLDGKKYTIFGKITEGQEIADNISKVEVDEKNKPKTPVIINKVTILE